MGGRRPGQSDCSLFTRGKIVGLATAGWSISAISREVGLSRSAVNYWLHKAQVDDDLVTVRPGPARKTTPEEDAAMIHHVAGNPTSTALQVRDTFNINCGVQTIRRRLKAAGVGMCKTPRKSRLGATAARPLPQYAKQRKGANAPLLFCDMQTFAKSEEACSDEDTTCDPLDVVAIIHD